MFDFDDFDYEHDCEKELEDGEHYGCELSECCEDCEYLADCDGCGNFYAPAPSPQGTRESAKEPPAPQKNEERQRRGGGALLACVGVLAAIALIIGILFA